MNETTTAIVFIVFSLCFLNALNKLFRVIEVFHQLSCYSNPAIIYFANIFESIVEMLGNIAPPSDK